jgi:hypothetical protein
MLLSIFTRMSFRYNSFILLFTFFQGLCFFLPGQCRSPPVSIHPPAAFVQGFQFLGCHSIPLSSTSNTICPSSLNASSLITPFLRLSRSRVLQHFQPGLNQQPWYFLVHKPFIQNFITSSLSS